MRFSLSMLYNLHATNYGLRLDHCAFWLTDMHRLSCVSGSKAFSACWVNDEDMSDLHQVAFVQAVASSMTKVAMYSPHRTGSLTEASWQPVKTICLGQDCIRCTLAEHSTAHECSNARQHVC